MPTIFVDNRTAAHTGSKGRVDAWQPYRQGTAITPRLNISKVSDAESACTTVFIGDCPAITTATKIAKSQGDEDTDGGLLNGGIKSGETTFETGSNTVIFEGNEAVRSFDLCKPNHGNGPLMPLIQPGGAPQGFELAQAALSAQQADALETGSQLVIALEAPQPDNRYGYLSVLGKDRSSPEAVAVAPVSIYQQQTEEQMQSIVTVAIPDIEPANPVSLWLLETDKVPAYTRQDIEAWPALGTDWARYCPIPLSFQSVLTQEDSDKINLDCACVYPVISTDSAQDESTDKWQLLPHGWLYLFMEGYLWREIKVTTVTHGMPIYHFSEVISLPQSGRLADCEQSQRLPIK
jgi:hypothetical protein